MAFAPKRADDRKRWMAQPPRAMDYTPKALGCADFIHCEYHAFCNARLLDIIPGLLDGLKRVQRKVIKVLKSTGVHKVPSVGGTMVSDAAYHHGDMSAHNAILNLAACYPGANNLALLDGDGATGSRHGKKGAEPKAGKKRKSDRMASPASGFQVGEDAAAARYVGVSRQGVVSLLFRKEDEVLYKAVVVDGEEAEPETLCPVLPLAAINGCLGIASGHLSEFPGREPLAILHAVRARLTGTAFPHLPPSYNGFRGSFVQARADERGGWDCVGVFEQHASEVTVTDIPLGFSILGYKAYLDQLHAEGKITKPVNASHSNKVQFTFSVKEGFEPTHKALGLVERVPALYKFIHGVRIVEFPTIEAYLEVWYAERVAWVTRRRDARIAVLGEEVRTQEEELGMLRALLALHVATRPELVKGLVSMGVDAKRAEAFLRGLRAWSVSHEGVAEAEGELLKARAAVAAYAKESVDAIMARELDELEPALAAQLRETAARNFAEAPRKKKKSG